MREKSSFAFIPLLLPLCLHFLLFVSPPLVDSMFLLSFYSFLFFILSSFLHLIFFCSFQLQHWTKQSCLTDVVQKTLNAVRSSHFSSSFCSSSLLFFASVRFCSLRYEVELTACLLLVRGSILLSPLSSILLHSLGSKLQMTPLSVSYLLLCSSCSYKEGSISPPTAPL